MAEPKIKETKWDKSFEDPITFKWRENEVYDLDTKDTCYIIDTPPPYINAPIHIGHATTYVLQDMFARFHRMLGEKVIFPLGLDRNGLPIEVAAEKKFKVRLHTLPREEAVAYCEKILEMTSLESTKSFERLGCSFTSWKFHTGKPGEAYMTDNPAYRSLTQDTFIELWNRGLIYFDKRINNYSPGLRTTIADSEIEYENLPSKFVHVKWKVKETDEEVIIATTRPELIASCGMVIFNPEDDRYKHLEGKHVILPLYGKEVLLKAHTDAKIDKGSGLVMMCSAGDYTDIRFFREQEINPVISINEDGCMNSNAGFLEGLPVKKAREEITNKLEEAGLVVKIENVIHRTPVCERSKVPVEFIEMEELYLKQKDFLDDVRKVAERISFYDPKSKKILDDWMDMVNIDWPISRRRFYATEIPLWHCKKCGAKVVPSEKGKYWQPWKDACPVEKCSCGASDWEGETRVLDTWFDSSISPLFNIKYLRDEEFYKNNKVCTLRPQGKEIVRTWLYYTLLRCYQLTGESIFKDAWIHYHVIDENGRKFSKSLGNGIDPQKIIDEFGTESFRLWCVSEGNIHEIDLRCSMDRIKGLSKSLNKLWNVSRFISSFVEEGEFKLNETDKWVLKELNRIIELTKTAYLGYDFHNPAKEIRHFIWETFSSHYLELVKTRAYNEEGKFSSEDSQGAIHTLNLVLDTVLKLWCPVLPIMTTKIYEELHGKDICSEKFPYVTGEFSVSVSREDLMELNSLIWKFKQDKGLSLKDSLGRVVVPEKFKEFGIDLKIAHKIEKLEFGTDLKFE